MDHVTTVFDSIANDLQEFERVLVAMEKEVRRHIGEIQRKVDVSAEMKKPQPQRSTALTEMYRLQGEANNILGAVGIVRRYREQGAEVRKACELWMGRMRF